MAVREVADFVTACRRFGDGSTSASGTLHLRTVAQKTMPERYHLPFPDVQLVRREGNAAGEARHLRGLWHELAQHLVDLGYLAQSDFLAYHQHRKQILVKPTLLLPIVAAVGTYLAEEVDWPELTAFQPPEGKQIELFWLRRHLGTVTERISRYTGWDGTLPTPTAYSPGQQNCYGRSLAYRLRTLSSSQFPLSATSLFQPGQLGELSLLLVEGLNLSGFASESNNLPGSWWEALTDIDLLLQLYLGNTAKRDASALLYQLPKEEESQLALDALPDAALRLPRINPRFYDMSRARKLLRNARRRQNRMDDGLDVRLLQVKLWQASYYVGAIDGEWGEVSHRALKAFLAEETEKLTGPISARSKRRIRSLLLPANVRQGVYAADLKGIIALFNADQATQQQDLDLLDNPEALDNLRAKAGISHTELDEKVLSEENLNDLYPNILDKPQRRVSFPSEGLLSRIWQGVKRIFRWLADKAKSLIEDILGPVFSFVKLSLRKIRMALQRFFEGFKYLANFLFGRPVVTEVAAEQDGAPPVRFATRFSLDFDGNTYAPPTFARGGAAEHSAHLMRMKDNMFYFIDTVIWLIKGIGRLSNPGGWVWLGWQLVRGLGGKL
ncbi:MAG: peptidoglycan-binding domain-containing protein [Bacteroidota bacterium]